MIYGIGVDIVLISRFEALYRRFKEKLAEKLFAEVEMAYWHRLPEAKRIKYLAKHFAAKEAASKALGTGFREGISLRDIAITRNQVGKPELHFYNQALQKITALKIKGAHVSFADESTHVVAMVVMECDK